MNTVYIISLIISGIIIAKCPLESDTWQG